VSGVDDQVLSKEQRMAARYLAAGATQENAANEVGVSIATIGRWVKKPVFRAVQESYEVEAMFRFQRRLIHAQQSSVSRIISLLSDRETSPAIIVAIAKMTLGPAFARLADASSTRGPSMSDAIDEVRKALDAAPEELTEEDDREEAAAS